MQIPCQVDIIFLCHGTKTSIIIISKRETNKQILIHKKRMLNLAPSFAFLLVLLLPLTLTILNFLISKKHPKNLPPGPKPWPIIGNILDLTKNSHTSLAHLSKLHGPLISLKLGTQILVVGSSPEAATEILKTHDRVFSARAVPKGLMHHPIFYDKNAIVWADGATDEWKILRTIVKKELFSARIIDAQASLREKKVLEMVKFLESKEGLVVNIGEVVFATVFNVLSNLLFSKDFLSLGGGSGSKLKRIIGSALVLGASPNIVDFFPILEKLDPQGIRRRITTLVMEMYTFWEVHIHERRSKNNNGLNGYGDSRKDLLDVFIASGFDDDRINWLVLELFGAGVDTTMTTIEWAVTELLKNKETIYKLKEELQREINHNLISESQVSQLPYLNACVKETFRIHPPVPFLIPHRALETCEVMGYEIPKDSRVIVNVWAIGHDPSVWKDPSNFNPDRFIGSNVDYKGQNFDLLPFGSGRRSCPGSIMADRQIHLILATLVHCFDWSLPNDGDFAKLDMDAKFGITLHKEKPLLLVPKRSVRWK